MTTALLIVAIAVALACPLHMLWAMRRGKRSLCCPPRRNSYVAALRSRQRALAAEIADAAPPAQRPPLTQPRS